MSDWTKEDFNSGKIIGRAGKDFETRFMPDGTAVSSGPIATGGGKKKDGSVYRTEWFDLKGFRKDDATGPDLADVIKGDTVWVKCYRLCQEVWDDKATGKPRSKVVLKVEEFEIVKKKGDGSVKGNTPAPDDDFDIPF